MNNRPPRKRNYLLWWLLLGISSLPFPLLYLLSDFLRLIAYRLIGYRKQVVTQNLQKAFPEKGPVEIKRLTAAFYRNLCDIILETLKLATISAENLQKRVQFRNSEKFEATILAGQPVLVMGSHQANWEWALSGAAVAFPFPADGIYKPLANPFFEWFMASLRSRLGARMVKMKDTLRHFIRHQQEARVISILSDQTPPRGEIQYWTRFLNQDTGFYVGADKLAANFKYPVYFIAARRLKRGYYEYSFELLIEEPQPGINYAFPVTEAYARTLEKWIKAYPADYLWSHKRWKHQKPVAEAVTIAKTS